MIHITTRIHNLHDNFQLLIEISDLTQTRTKLNGKYAREREVLGKYSMANLVYAAPRILIMTVACRAVRRWNFLKASLRLLVFTAILTAVCSRCVIAD